MPVVNPLSREVVFKVVYYGPGLGGKTTRLGAPAFGSVAMTCEGIYEALEAVTRSVLEQFEARLPTERGARAPGLELPEAGLAEAFRAADTPERAEPQLSFELLWPPAERGLVRELERALATGDHGRAVAECETLVARALAGAAAALGTSDAPRDPATVALVLRIARAGVS